MRMIQRACWLPLKKRTVGGETERTVLVAGKVHQILLEQTEAPSQPNLGWY